MKNGMTNLVFINGISYLSAVILLVNSEGSSKTILGWIAVLLLLLTYVSTIRNNKCIS